MILYIPLCSRFSVSMAQKLVHVCNTSDGITGTTSVLDGFTGANLGERNGRCAYIHRVIMHFSHCAHPQKPCKAPRTIVVPVNGILYVSEALYTY